MLRNLGRVVDLPWSQALRHCSSAVPAPAGQEVAAKRGPRWRNTLKYRVRKADLQVDVESDLYAGVILERYPICLPQVEGWRAEFREWQASWNAWKYKTAKKGWLDSTKQIVDENSPEANFKPEPLRTEADEADDRTSLRRNTQGWLYLATRGPADGAPWRLPRTRITGAGDEPVRDGAYRAVHEALGDSIETFMLGHMPAAHLRGADGETTFLMLGLVLDGHPQLADGSDAAEFAWLTRREMLEAYAGDSDALPKLEVLLVE